MTSPTINGITLIGVTGIDVDKTPNIIPIPVPTLDSDKTEVFDMLGVIKLITVNGEYNGATATIKTFVDSLEAMANGNQAPISFTSDQTGTISVMVADVHTVWSLPGTAMTYDLKLIQGGQA